MVPKNLQGVLWSVDTDQLDLQKNKSYIVNQILAYGTWEHLRWLLKSYSREEIKKVFVEHPGKDYSPSAFNFAKNVLLELQNQPLDQTKYVKTFPRNIR